MSLQRFRRLEGSPATGAHKRQRLTNLLANNVDTSWYLRYRSMANPDFGATFGQAVTINNQPVIPLNDTDATEPAYPGTSSHPGRVTDTGDIEQPGVSLRMIEQAARACTRRCHYGWPA